MFEDCELNIDLNVVKKDILIGIKECYLRGLLHSAKFLSELIYGLDETTDEQSPQDDDFDTGICDDEYDEYFLAKSYYDLREYARSAHFTKSCKSSVPMFLHFYCTYMAKEKKRLDNMTENTNYDNSNYNKSLTDLFAILKHDYDKNKLDGYCLYIYGVVLKKLDLMDMAIEIFVESLKLKPIMWGSWVELAPLIASKEALLNLDLPNHWMKELFFGYTFIELYLNDESLSQFAKLQNSGFSNCNFITAQIATAHHNKRDVDKAIEIFQSLQKKDPFRLDNLDTYSNLLFVKERRQDIAVLAEKALQLDKYKPETCCAIGNYYSIRNEHQKAILYFQRALKLNPQYLSAWTLMGHEFMELKNTNAAVQSYRQAIDVNRRDFRAWYGLGQAYDLLKMPFYSLYYYGKAQSLRPNDSRMLVGLGESYEKVNEATAIKCYKKAIKVGDIEGVALLKLANLYGRLGDTKNAIPAYIKFCADPSANVDPSSLAQAYITIANYYEGIDMINDAIYYANKCLEHDENKTEAKNLLKKISHKTIVLEPLSSGLVTVGSIDEANGDMIVEVESTDDILAAGPPQNDEDKTNSSALDISIEY